MAKERDVSQVSQPRIVQPPNLPSIYCNNVRSALGLFDVRLFFAEAVPTAEEVIATDKVCIILSPEMLKPLAEALTRSVVQYEEQFGKLRNIPAPVEVSKKKASLTATEPTR